MIWIGEINPQIEIYLFIIFTVNLIYRLVNVSLNLV